MRTVGLIIMVAGLIGMWVSTFALIYLQGHLDVLRWSLKWLKWEQATGQSTNQLALAGQLRAAGNRCHAGRAHQSGHWCQINGGK